MYITSPTLPFILLSALTHAFPQPPPDGSPNSPITRNGTFLHLNNLPWTASGANVYWLGLDENVNPGAGEPYYAPLKASYPTKGRITEIMATLKTMGAKTVRSQTMGVSVGNPLSIMPELGVVNENAFESMDWAVKEARRYGIRIFAPFTDNYDYYHGGKFVFLRWRGIDSPSQGNNISPEVQQFYTNRTIIDDFKNYIKVILTHKNQYTNLTYAEDPTIFAYETGNELGGPKFGDKDVPAAWTEEITAYIKELAPLKLTVDGTYGINESHLNLTSVDIYSDHFYPIDLQKLSKGAELVGQANKAYFAAEYGWTPAAITKDSMESFFEWIENRNQANSTNPVVVGDHFWSLFGRNVPDCSTYVDHDDGFTLHYNDPRNTPEYTAQITKIRQHLFKMQGAIAGQDLPSVPCTKNVTEVGYVRY